MNKPRLMDEPINRTQEQVKKAQQLYEDGRQKAQQMYEDGRRKIQDMATTATERSRQAMNVTDDWVRQNPWMTVGVAVGIGLIIGLLLGQGGGRRSDED